MISLAATESNRIRETFPASNSSITKRSAICIVGINNADYVVNPSVAGVRCPCNAYSTWRGMITRCYDNDYKIKHTAYLDATCSKEWNNFMSFREWWIEHHIDGYEIDKDILSLGASHYSKETCIFVPRWLNNFCTITRDNKNAVGVFYDESRGKYKASIGYLGRTINIGRYNSEREASNAWLKTKLDITISRKNDIESISKGLYDKVVELILSRVETKK